MHPSAKQQGDEVQSSAFKKSVASFPGAVQTTCARGRKGRDEALKIVQTTNIRAETDVSLILQLCSHKVPILEFEHGYKRKGHYFVQNAKVSQKSISQTDIDNCYTLRR